MRPSSASTADQRVSRCPQGLGTGQAGPRTGSAPSRWVQQGSRRGRHIASASVASPVTFPLTRPAKATTALLSVTDSTAAGTTEKGDLPSTRCKSTPYTHRRAGVQLDVPGHDQEPTQVRSLNDVADRADPHHRTTNKAQANTGHAHKQPKQSKRTTHLPDHRAVAVDPEDGELRLLRRSPQHAT